MNRLAREIKRSQREVEAAQGNLTFTWAGNSYACVADDTLAEGLLTIGGFQPGAALTLHVRSELLPSPGPAENQTVTFSGRTYRIDQLRTVHGCGIVELILEDPARSA